MRNERRHGWTGCRAWRAVRAALWATGLWSMIAPGDVAAGTGGHGEGWGIRAGLSSAPDQLVVGLQYDAGEVARRVRFVPNFTLGVGDHRTVITLNPDILCSFPVDNDGWIYAGGMIGVVWRNWDDSWHSFDARGRRSYRDDSEIDLGVAGIFGYRTRWSGRTAFLEGRIRVSDAYPDVQLVLGTSFRG